MTPVFKRDREISFIYDQRLSYYYDVIIWGLIGFENGNKLVFPLDMCGIKELPQFI